VYDVSGRRQQTAQAHPSPASARLFRRQATHLRFAWRRNKNAAFSGTLCIDVDSSAAPWQPCLILSLPITALVFHPGNDPTSDVAGKGNSSLDIGRGCIVPV
jgi:hypothetical protein